jgi:chaperonin GroES
LRFGPGKKDENGEVEIFVEIGDRVIVNKYSGTEVKYDGEDLIILKQDDILATVE